MKDKNKASNQENAAKVGILFEISISWRGFSAMFGYMGNSGIPLA